MHSKQSIIEQLTEMNAPKTGVVLVHSSLRAVGEVEGRGEAVLDALIEYFTASGGLLCVPTHTWAFVDEPITLDLMQPKTCIGTLPNLALLRTGGVRTMHPTHSMVVFGKNATAFAAGEERADTPAPTFGAYGKIDDLDGHILLVGVGHNRNTFLHGVEERIGVKNRLSPEKKALVVRHADGRTETVYSHVHFAEGIKDVSAHYPKFEPVFRANGCIRDGFIGDAPVQLCSARKMREVLETVYGKAQGEELLFDGSPLAKRLYP